MRILLCGYGFIGRNLHEKLWDLGHDVNFISRAKAVVSGSYGLDLKTNTHALCHIIQNLRPEVIYLLAADPSTRPDNNTLDNTQIVLNVLEAIENTGYASNSYRPRLVFTSSATVYSPLALKEGACEYSPTEPSSAYGVSKLSGENYCRLLLEKNKLNSLAILRLTASCGKYQSHGLVKDIVRKIKESKNNRIELIGKYPGTIKPYMHVSDTVDALVQFGCSYENITLNITNSDSRTVQQVFWEIKDVVNPKCCLSDWTGDTWHGDNHIVKVSGQKALAEYNWCPRFNSLESVRLGAIDLCGS